jgi:hypothetical protein
MELLTDFMSELVSDGELMLARALRSKFIQKYEDRRSRLLPDLDTSGLSLSSISPFLPILYPTLLILEILSN